MPRGRNDQQVLPVACHGALQVALHVNRLVRRQRGNATVGAACVKRWWGAPINKVPSKWPGQDSSQPKHAAKKSLCAAVGGTSATPSDSYSFFFPISGRVGTRPGSNPIYGFSSNATPSAMLSPYSVVVQGRSCIFLHGAVARPTAKRCVLQHAR